MNVRRWMGLAGLGLLAGLMALTPPPAQAGSLDKALLLHTGEVLSYLKENNIKNVGVLPFQVKRGSRKPAVGTTPLSTNLPESIENALIMVMEPNEKAAVGIIRNAAGTISRARPAVGPYRTSKASYDKLYRLTYDLAWKGQKVKADAFLTGTVINAGPDRRSTTVEIQLLRPTSWKNGKLVPEKTWKFKSRTDAMLVANLGYNFSLSPAVLKRGLKAKALRRDDLVVDQVTREDEKGDKRPAPGQTTAHTPSNIAGFVFELEYNGEKQPITQVGNEFRAPRPPMGARITMHLTRTDDDPGKRGVLLVVNGESTFNKEKGDYNQMRKWIYGPESKDRRDTWEGFYTGTSGRNLLRFKSLTAEESESHMESMGEKFGLIEVVVYGSREPQSINDGKGKEDEKKEDEVKPDEKKGDDKKGDEKKEDEPEVEKKEGEKKEKTGDKEEKADELLITTRGLVSRSTNLSLPQLRAKLLKANNVRMKPRKESLVRPRGEAGGLILHEPDAVEGGEIGTSDLPYAEMIAKLTIRYYDKPAAGGAPIEQDR